MHDNEMEYRDGLLKDVFVILICMRPPNIYQKLPRAPLQNLWGFVCHCLDISDVVASKVRPALDHHFQISLLLCNCWPFVQFNSSVPSKLTMSLFDSGLVAFNCNEQVMKVPPVSIDLIVIETEIHLIDRYQIILRRLSQENWHIQFSVPTALTAAFETFSCKIDW